MLNSLEVLAGKLSPRQSSGVSAGGGGRGAAAHNHHYSSLLDTNANRVHPYLKNAALNKLAALREKATLLNLELLIRLKNNAARKLLDPKEVYKRYVVFAV
ncbi:unnamed protein product [Acanthoscelides obtectus]|uniref:Uncharacterized protein n=1 Tax=Acanthoscelides obtectus TaxID=200917 RepID=A0A9P0KT31_ACAOB|nr:unnamed protein product [Acanthoscelides obtectus]CAK1623244.1 hypothetical protein AOBTE_LOCUS1907 [Acanthoscelides obtectus]